MAGGGRTLSRLVKGALPLLTLGATVAWLGLGEQGPSRLLASVTATSAAPLHAATTQRASTSDLDGDGLPDALERRLGTKPDVSDSDGDGYSDSEELARGSSPLSSQSVPGPDPLGVALGAYQTGGPLQLVSILYAQDGDFSSKKVTMGARVGAFVRTTPLAFFTHKAEFATVPGLVGGSQVMVIDASVDPLLVKRFGSLSFFTTLSNSSKLADADVVNTLWKDDMLLEYVVTPLADAPLPGSDLREAGSQGRYEPIDPEGIPAEWVPDQICAQTMMVSANIGPVVIQEVVEAACQEGWDAYCDPACPATVGSTVETLDPGALIGG
jgi:hypothetical protein